MKKFVVVLALAGVFITPVAQAKEWKEVIVAMDATYPPFESVAPDGTLVGFDVDLAHAVCAEMKVKCKLVNVGWDGLIPGLVAKKHDAIWTTMNISDERKKVVDFSNAYFHMQNRFVARKGANIAISKEGLIVATLPNCSVTKLSCTVAVCTAIVLPFKPSLLIAMFAPFLATKRFCMWK